MGSLRLRHCEHWHTALVFSALCALLYSVFNYIEKLNKRGAVSVHLCELHNVVDAGVVAARLSVVVAARRGVPRGVAHAPGQLLALRHLTRTRMRRMMRMATRNDDEDDDDEDEEDDDEER